MELTFRFVSGEVAAFFSKIMPVWALTTSQLAPIVSALKEKFRIKVSIRFTIIWPIITCCVLFSLELVPISSLKATGAQDSLHVCCKQAFTYGLWHGGDAVNGRF